MLDLARQFRERVRHRCEIRAGAVLPFQPLDDMGQRRLDVGKVGRRAAAFDFRRQRRDRRDERSDVLRRQTGALPIGDRAAERLFEMAGVELLRLPLHCLPQSVEPFGEVVDRPADDVEPFGMARDGFAHRIDPLGERVDLGRAAERLFEPSIHRRQRRIDAVGVDHRRIVELVGHGAERALQPLHMRRQRGVLQARAHAFDAAGEILDRPGIERDGGGTVDRFVEPRGKLAQREIDRLPVARLIQPGADFAQRGLQTRGVRREPVLALHRALHAVDAARKLLDGTRVGGPVDGFLEFRRQIAQAGVDRLDLRALRRPVEFRADLAQRAFESADLRRQRAIALDRLAHRVDAPGEIFDRLHIDGGAARERRFHLRRQVTQRGFELSDLGHGGGGAFEFLRQRADGGVELVDLGG